MGMRARSAMEEWGADDAEFGRLVGANDEPLAHTVAARVRAKLADSPVEAMCIDFEDGYGPRSDAEEDADAMRTARDLAQVPAGRPNIGIRIKPLSRSTAGRAIRTLDLFVTTYARESASASKRAIRPGFTVTLPKVTRPDEVVALVDLLALLETSLAIPPVNVELMIETPRALVDERGVVATRALVDAGRGRVEAVHLGAYDLTAELGVTAGDQRLDHPYCDFARTLLALSVGQVTAISDGATTLLPIAPKGASPSDSAAAIHRAWSVHAANVRRAIDFGIWQGWDLHPAQLPARYGVLYAYFLERREKLAERLATFVERATQASRVGQVFDDAATAQGLVTFFLRGLACGALGESDLARTTLTKGELEARSFANIVAARIP
jgi:citrate lyase beta subunit